MYIVNTDPVSELYTSNVCVCVCVCVLVYMENQVGSAKRKKVQTLDIKAVPKESVCVCVCACVHVKLGGQCQKKEGANPGQLFWAFGPHQ